jgi:hypothetical protein
MRWMWLALLMVFSTAAVSDEIWRWVDENGVVHYSDRPRPGAERVDLRPAQTFTPPPVATPAPRPATEPAPATEEEDVIAYSELRIVSPRSQEVLWNIGARLDVEISVVPGLRSNHVIRVYLDGVQAAVLPPGRTSVRLENVFRGERQLRAVIVDQRGRELVATDPLVFFVQQTTLNSPARPTNPRPTPR